MREHFSHYYALTPEQLSELSKTAIIAFDASFLLDLYRYSTETVSQMFLVLTGLSDQIWVPHQAAYEFHKNRLEVIGRLKSKHEAVLKRCKEDGDRLIKSIEADCAKHLTSKLGRSPRLLLQRSPKSKKNSMQSKISIRLSPWLWGGHCLEKT